MHKMLALSEVPLGLELGIRTHQNMKTTKSTILNEECNPGKIGAIGGWG